MSLARSTEPARPRSATSSRLVRFLAELFDADQPVSHQRFIERLGQSFDLADSIKISAVHDAIIGAPATPRAHGVEAVKAEFERVRASIVSSAVQSFGPGEESIRLRFPGIHAGMTDEKTLSPEPYVTFYVAQQRNVDVRIRDLHASTRDALAQLSAPLARLAALDAVLAEPLAAPARKAFAAVPRLLRRRFDTLLDEHRRDAAEPANDRARWEHILEQLRREMQGLLLAEIDTRLLPTLGLIEALDENEND